MKAVFSVLILLVVLSTQSVFADCAVVKEPLSSERVADLLGPNAGLYEDIGAREDIIDGKKVFTKKATLISRDGIKTGYTVYPSLFEPYTKFEEVREYSIGNGRVSSPLAELNGSIVFEVEGAEACHVIAINIRDNSICQSPFVSFTGDLDLESLEACALLKKTE